jgi:hypothetical protein
LTTSTRRTDKCAKWRAAAVDLGGKWDDTGGVPGCPIPVAVLFIVFQRHFNSSDIGSGVKG